MLMILIDAAILIGLLAAFQEEELSFGFAAIMALVTSLVTFALAYVLFSAMGLPGVYLALVIAAVLLGIALSALYGMEIKRAVMVACIFMVAHAVISYGLSSMMNRGAQAAVEAPATLLLA
jgi:hypothetical protein